MYNIQNTREIFTETVVERVAMYVRRRANKKEDGFHNGFMKNKTVHERPRDFNKTHKQRDREGRRREKAVYQSWSFRPISTALR